ncbi:MAG: hypothetical protein IT445_11430 [Phycisphaeraceae bacterium]|nr:hypothetical protein [Phycisphaeraceae bacterium]
MAIDVSNLRLSLAHAMAQAADPAATLGTDLFVHQLPASAPGSSATGAGAVLRIYGGPVEGELRPVPGVSVQCMVYATDAAEGLLLAQRLYGALHDADNDGRPRTHWTIAAKKIDATSGDLVDDTDLPGGWDIRLIVLTSGPPGIVGRGDAAAGGRWEIAFNFDVHFTAP